MSQTTIQTIGLTDSLVTSIKIATGAVTIAKINFENALVPIGGIIMWSGTIANIPTGWALCNGSNATPDLRNRFVVGAHSDGAGGAGPGFNADDGTLSSNYTPGNTGGETAHQLSIPELASHSHQLYNQIGGGGNSVGGGGSNTSDQQSGSAGGSKFHENRPPYYALAFIMRIS